MGEEEILSVEEVQRGDTGNEHRFVAHSKLRDIGFTVIREEVHGEKGWAVRIEGVPEPSIVHEHPWETIDAARDAAVHAVGTMLTLERKQREEEERNRKR